MTWIKIDDGITEHRRFVGLTPNAWCLWLHGLTYCSRNLTDGHIPAPMVPRLTAMPQWRKALSELLDAGLWVKVEGGYEVDTPPDAAQVAVRVTRHGPVFADDIANGRRPHMPHDLRQLILDRDSHQCVQCGATEPLHIDHVVPLRHGGSFYSAGNLQVLCGPCNQSKGATL